MTKREAKKITLEVWGYLRDHPEIDDKKNLPDRLWNKIKNTFCECAMCEIYNHDCKNKMGDICHLRYRGLCYNFSRWLNAECNSDRSKWAGKLYDTVKAWKV